MRRGNGLSLHPNGTRETDVALVMRVTEVTVVLKGKSTKDDLKVAEAAKTLHVA